MMKNYSGYIGLFKQPVTDPTNLLSTVYCVADPNKNTAIFIVLTPQAYYTVFEIARRLTYVNIIIITPSMDILFASDIFNLFMYFHQFSDKNVKWIFPIKLSYNSSIDFEDNQIVTDNYAFNDPIYGFTNVSVVPAIELIESGIDGRIVYDIKLFDGDKTIYFSMYNTDTKSYMLFINEFIDEIHVNYNTSLYGGLYYDNIIAIDSNYAKKFIVNDFTSKEEGYYCKDHGISMGKVIYNDLV